MIRILGVLCISILFVSFSAQADEDKSATQTLQNALFNAFQNNPGLRAERAALRATEEELPQARANWFPTMELSAGINAQNSTGENTDNSTDGAVTKDVGFSLSQPIFRGGRTFSETREAKHTVSAERANVLNEEQDLFLDTVESYTEVIRNRAVVELQLKNEELLKERLVHSQKRFDGGEGTITDVSQAKARLSRATADRIDAEVDLETAEAKFENLTGAQPPQNMKTPALRKNFFKNLPELIEMAMESNPEILEAHYDYLAAKEEIDIEKRALFPQVSLSASYTYEDEPQPGTKNFQDTSSLGLRVSVPFYQGGGVRSRVREAKNTANQERLDLMQTMRDVRESVTSNWQEYRAAKARIESRKIQVEAARDARRSVFMEVQVGERTYIDLLDADQEILDATVDLVSAERTAILEEYGLLADIGLLNAAFLNLNTEKAYTPTPAHRSKTIGERFKGHWNMDVKDDVLESDKREDGYTKKLDIKTKNDKHFLQAPLLTNITYDSKIQPALEPIGKIRRLLYAPVQKIPASH